MNKWFLRIFLASIIGLASSAIAMEAQEPEEKASKYIPNYVPRGLLIFLDQSEKGEVGAITIQLLDAIKHKTSPILVSESVIGNLFSDYKNVDSYKKNSPQELENIAQELDPFIRTDQNKAKKYLTICLIAAKFNPEQWIIKKYESSTNYYLLIPQTYLDTLEIKISRKTTASFDQETTTNPQKMSALELKLGLKINHIPDGSIKDLENIQEERIGKSDRDYNFVSALPDLFCTRTDYLNAQEKTRAYWSIYLSGHGKTKETIAALSLEDFKKTLHFLSYKIYTRALMYMSCYSAGTNTQAIFAQTKSTLQETYPFTLITMALTDAPVSINRPFIVNDRKALNLTTTTDFTQLIKNMMQEPADYEAATKAISTPDAVSSPQIKLPGTEWFSVLGNKKSIVSIGSILSKSRDPQQQLDVASFFKTDPSNLSALLIYAADIPFPLNIDAPNNLAIISMIPGAAFHRLKAITSSANANSVLFWFMAIDQLDAYKIFYIEKINDIEDVVIVYEKIPGKTGFFTTQDKFTCTAYFQKQGTSFVTTKRFVQPQQCSTEQRDIYSIFLSKIRGGYSNLGNYHFESYWEFQDKLPALKTSTIIEGITGKANMDINKILNSLYDKIKGEKNTVLWCKTITAPFYSGDYHFYPAGVDRDTSITLNDVIFDSDDLSKVRYTYNRKFYVNNDEINQDYREEYKKHRALIPGQLSGAILPSQATAEEIKKIGGIYQKQIENFPKIEKKNQDKKQKIEPLPKAEKPADMEKFEVEDYKGNTPLHNAAEAGRLDVARYLIEEKGFAVNVPNKQYKQTPLYLAAKAGALDIVRYLIENKAPVDGIDPILRETPLHAAAAGNHLSVVKYLVRDAGANVNLRNKFYERPIDLAKDRQIKYILTPKN